MEKAMMKRLVTTLGAAVACGTALFAQETDAQETDMTTDETRIELSAVPPSIMEAARNAVEVEFTYARLEQEPGGLTYELGGKTPDGMNVEVDLLEDATVEEVERQLPSMEDVPTEISDAVMSEYPGFEAALIEAVEVNEELLRYEFEGMADGEDLLLEVTVLGNILSTSTED